MFEDETDYKHLIEELEKAYAEIMQRLEEEGFMEGLDEELEKFMEEFMAELMELEPYPLF